MNKEVIPYSKIELELMAKKQNFKKFDENLSVWKFRKKDYELHLNEVIDSFMFIKTINPKINANVTINTVRDTYRFESNNRLNKIKFILESNRNEEFSALIPALFKDNYYVLNGIYYTVGLFLELSPINIYSDKLYKIIKLGVLDILKHNRKTNRKGEVIDDKIVFGKNKYDTMVFVNLLKTMDDKESSIELFSCFGIETDNRSFREFFETQVFRPYYRELLMNHYNEIMIDEGQSEHIKHYNIYDANDYIDLIVDIINLDFIEVNYNKLNHRRLVSAEYLFENLHWFVRNRMVAEYNNKQQSVRLNNRCVLKTFVEDMHNATPYAHSSPVNFDIFKITQKLKGQKSDSRLKSGWREYDRSHFKVFCPISVSAGNMATNLYITQGGNINKFGKIFATQDSKLFSPMAHQSSLILSGVASARAQMLQKYHKQLVYDANMEEMYIQSNDIFIDKNSIFNEIAPKSGKVIEENRYLLKVQYDDESTQVFELTPFKTTDRVNGVMLEKHLHKGDEFNKDDIIVQYYDPNKRCYRIKNVAYIPFFGFTAEDTLVYSEEQVCKMRSAYSETVLLPITNDLSLTSHANVGDEIVQNKVFEYIIGDKHGIIKSNGIVVDVRYHNISKIPIKDIMTKLMVDNIIESYDSEFKETLFTEDEIELFFGRSYSNGGEITIEDLKKTNTYNNLSDRELRLKIKELNNKQRNISFNKKELEILFRKVYGNTASINKLIGIIEIKLIDYKLTGMGDKMIPNMYAGKGTIGKILPMGLSPIINGTDERVDVFFNPFGSPRRHNWSTMIEGYLGKIIETIQAEQDPKVMCEMLSLMRDHIMKYSVIDTQYKSLCEQQNVNKLVEEIMNGKLFVLELESDDSKINFKRVHDFVEMFDKTFDTTIMELKTITYSPELLKWLVTQDYDLSYIDTNKPLSVKCQVLSNSTLKLNQISYSKANSTNHIVRKDNVSGKYQKGRRNQGATSVSWLYFNALLASNWTPKKTPVQELNNLMYLKSDASEEVINKALDLLIKYGRKYDLTPIFEKQVFSTQMQLVNTINSFINMKLTGV